MKKRLIVWFTYEVYYEVQGFIKMCVEYAYFKVISSCMFKIKISFSPNYTSTIEIP